MTTTKSIIERRLVEENILRLLTTELARGNPNINNKLISLQAKLAAGQLHLAVLGQMKRGKSSLINALLRAEVLPTGILPVTAIITELRYGPEPEATIVYSVGGLREKVALNSLSEYITEAGNPANRKQVASVEVVYPSPLLESGIILIDTPGVGSTHLHNTRTTERYLEKVDAGIVVLSIDPPMTEVEADFIKDLKADIPKLFFVINKTDGATAKEVSTLVRFLECELDRLQVSSPEIFPLSARLRKQQDASTEHVITLTGLTIFEQRLRNFLSAETQQTLCQSISLDVLEIARALRFAAAVGSRAATMSSGELQAKRREVGRLLEQTRSGMREMQLLLRQRTADIVTNVEEELSAYVASRVSEVREHLTLFQLQNPHISGRALGAQVERFLSLEIQTIFEKWRVQEERAVQQQLDTLSARFVSQANELLKHLEHAASSLFKAPIEHLTVTCSLQVESRLRYRVERVFDSLDSFLLVLPGVLLRPIIFRRLLKNIPLLLDMNAGRIRYDYLERLQTSISAFEAKLSGAIAMVIECLEAALRPSSDAPGAQSATLATLDAVIAGCTQAL
jgi:GTP-binding protein EngB required for normal cell division